MIQVFYCDITPFQNQMLYERYYAFASEERKKHICVLHKKEDRQRALAGWLMLQCALNDQKIAKAQRRIVCAENGKPYLADHTIRFSISHSGKVALCAVCESEIGADVQMLHVPSPALQKRILSVTEQNWLRQQPDFARGFTGIWTRKESFLKATGRTIFCDLQTVSCLPGLTLELDGQHWHFLEAELFDQPASVCCLENQKHVAWRSIDLHDEEIQNSFDSWS